MTPRRIGTLTIEVGRRTVYPSFYGAVHRAWNEELQRYASVLKRMPGGYCPGDPDRFEPDEHACYELAGLIRVELHAAGVRLSIDDNGSRVNPNRHGQIRSIVNSEGDDPDARAGRYPTLDEPSLRSQIADGERYELPDDVGQQAHPPPGGLWAFVRHFFGIRSF